MFYVCTRARWITYELLVSKLHSNSQGVAQLDKLRIDPDQLLFTVFVCRILKMAIGDLRLVRIMPGSDERPQTSTMSCNCVV